MLVRHKNSWWFRPFLAILPLLFVTFLVFGGQTKADVLKSPDYQLQPTVGNSFGGTVGSTDYSLVDSGGEAAIGDGSGGSYKLGAGFAAELTHSINLYVEPAGLVGYWPMNEGAGPTVHDATADNNDGTINGTPSWAQGKIGGTLSFNGSNDVDIPNSSSFNFNNNNPFSVSTWIDPSSVTTRQDIVGHEQQSGNYPGWAFRISQSSNDGKLYVILQNNAFTSVKIEVKTNSALQNNIWYFVTMTYDGSSSAGGVKIYINGTQQATTTDADSLTASMQSSVDLNIGNGGDKTGSTFFHGLIDDVKIYNRALSAAEVEANYQAGLAGFDAGLVIPTITPGTSETVDADAIVDADTPYILYTQGSLLKLISNSSVTIPSISNTIASPGAWAEGTTQGLGFTVTSGPSASPPDPKWGSGADYAAIPSTSTSFYTREGFSGGAKDVIGLEYRLDVSPLQPAGQYQNAVIYTATMTP